MTIIDWILVGIFGIFIIRGIFRGFFVELSEVVAIIVGYLVARSLGPVFGAWLDNFLPLAVWITYIIAFITVFITVVVIIHILGTLLHKASKLSALGILERIAGGVFGGVRCLAQLMVLVLLLAVSPMGNMIGQHLERGLITRALWNTTENIRNYLGWERVSITDLIPNIDQLILPLLDNIDMGELADFLREQDGDLLQQLFEQAPESIHDYVGSGIGEDGSLTIPDPDQIKETIENIPPDVQQELRELLEDQTKSTEERAAEFWQMLQQHQPDIPI